MTSTTEKARKLWTYQDVRFARIAEEMGALGISVDKPGDFPAALEQAIESGRPAVIDVRTGIAVVAPLPVTA